MRTRSSIFDPRSSSAFTIVELMISIAMVVILMIGINQVFKMSSDTVGMGHSIADMSRDNRSVQNIFNSDFDRMLKNAPLFIIRSGVAGAPNSWGAFTTEAERSADRDIATNPQGALTQDFNNNGTEGDSGVPGEITSLATYNSRNHRIDIIGFPANGLFRRATANDGSYSSQITSQDAFIFYEHVKLPSAPGGAVTYYDPGDPVAANVNNSLASQWVLGRIALLMREPPMLINGVPAPDNFIARTALPLSPLHFKSIGNDPAAQFVWQSRYDLLGASLETLRQDVADVRASVLANPSGPPFEGPNSIWWQPLVYRQLPAAPPVNSFLMRFESNPHIAKPITSESMAKAMPVLLNNCSQFLVEYAGDFLTQDNDQYVLDNSTPPKLVYNINWGNVTGFGPDGVVDYVVDHTKVTNADYNVAARTRWYGLPRDTATAPTENGPVIRSFSPGPSWPRDMWDKGKAYGGATRTNELIDVVPLWDVIQAYNASLPPGAPTYSPAPFERELPIGPPPGGDYLSGLTNAPKGVQDAYRYTCVWVNNAPTMIRIVLKLEDPAGRLPDGQWFEYVVGAP